MKHWLIICLLLLAATGATAQYYLRGAVVDANGNGIYNVKIQVHSKGTIPYFTGTSGTFGIPLSNTSDSILLQADGYETLHTIAYTSSYQTFTLKFTAGATTITKKKLASLIPANEDMRTNLYQNGNETYTTLIENDFTKADQYPETGFALNINRASYSNIRRFIHMDMKVPADAVRIEEMLNYFNFNRQTPQANNRFTCQTQLTQAPWNVQNRLLFINIQAPVLALDSIPPSNLVFLIDVSGSMDQPNRLPLLKEAFKMLVNNLRQQDTVAIVIYGGIVGTYLPPTSGIYKDSIKTAIEKLEAGGETPGEAALKTAYKLAEEIYHKEANNRIILASDGDFNVGITSDKELEDLVIQHRQSGIALTCLGVGMGNYKDSKLEALAKKGNGNFAYLDNINEAEKTLVTEFTKTIYTIASNAYVTVHFNPDYVSKYRLIGFDNKKELVNDTTRELEGGEIGTGHAFRAVFEIETTGYFNDTIAANSSNYDIADLLLHYHSPVSNADNLLPFTAINNYRPFTMLDSSYKLASAVIMFGGLLKQSDLWQHYNWSDVFRIAKSAANPNNYAEAEFLNLLEAANKLYIIPKKRKQKKERGF